jgi:ribosomal protein S18 acetylase RimI-like enzyme
MSAVADGAGACRKATPGDATPPHRIAAYDDARHRAGVITLWQMAFGYETAHNEPGLSIDQKRAAADGLFWVASDDRHQVVGSTMAGWDGHRGWLYAVAVHPLHRRSGLGSALVRTAEQPLVQRGCLKINLQLLAGNAATAAFYERLGYAIEPRISMGKVVMAPSGI